MLNAKPTDRNTRGLLARAWRITKVRAQEPKRSAFRSGSAQHQHLNAEDEITVFYIGLGDQFDDERRTVRETASRSALSFRP